MARRGGLTKVATLHGNVGRDVQAEPLLIDTKPVGIHRDLGSHDMGGCRRTSMMRRSTTIVK